MLNKILLFAALLSFPILMLSAAQPEKPRIPPPTARELMPDLTQEDAGARLAEFRKRIQDTKKFPDTLQAYMSLRERAMKKEKDTESGEVVKMPESISVTSVRALRRSFYSFLMNPDLEEVTGIKLEWFVNIYNSTEKMNIPARYFELALSTQDALLYTKALAAYREGADFVLKTMKEKKPRLNSEQLQKIKDINRKRREKAYYAREQAKLKEAAESMKNNTATGK